MPYPIDKSYLISSLKEFDSKILNKKYAQNNNDELHTHGNKDVLDKLDISENGSLLFDGEKIKNEITEFNFNDMEQISTLTDADKFLIGTEEGNRSMNSGNLMKAIMDQIGEIPSGEAQQVMQVPFLYGYKILVKDFDVTIPAGKSNTKVFNLSDFGLSMKDFVSAEVINISESSTLALDQYFIKDEFNIITYNASNLSSSLPLTIRVALIVKDNTIQLPYIYGYKLVTKEVTVDAVINSRMVTLCPISDLGENVVADDILSVTSTLNFAGFDNAISCFVDRDTNNIEGMWDYIPSRAVSGIKINIAAIIKDTSTTPKEKEPRLRTITLTKVLSSEGNTNTRVFSDISEFGEGLTFSDVVSAAGYNLSKSENVWVTVNSLNKVCINNTPTVGSTYKVTLTVKDYSDIGSEIVTENVKMITKNVTGTFSNSNIGHTGVFLSDLGIDSTDIVSITNNFITGRGSLKSPCIENDEIILISDGSLNLSVNCVMSIFVRVPVVEQLPRFTKDVEVNFVSGKALLFEMDGSENCGGFTKETIHSVNTIAIDGNAPIDSYYFEGDILYGVQRGGYTGKALQRITIE